MLQKIGVVILAAGKGTRMQHELPKVLVPVRGKAMILRAVEAVERAFGHKPIVVIGHRGDLVRRTLRSRVRYVRQTRPLGTGHAVAAAANLLRGRVTDVVVVYGDSPFITVTMLRRLVMRRRTEHAALAMTTVTVPDFRGPRRVFYRYGHLERDRSKRFIVRCVEFKDATRRQRAIREVNSGHYCFEAAWLWRHLPKLKRNNMKHEYYLTDLIGMAVAAGDRVVPLPLKNWIEGIGLNSVDDIRAAERMARYGS